MYYTDYDYNYAETAVPCRIWFSDESKVVETIIYLGAVQVEKIPRWVAEACPPKTAVVHGVPHWYAKDDGSDTSAFTSGYVEAAFNHLAKNYEIKHTVNIIADSQAVPGVLCLFTRREYVSYVKKIVLLQPLGLNADSFGRTKADRMRVFQKRVVQNTSRQVKELLRDSKLRYNHKLLPKYVNFRSKKTRAQYNAGLQHDSIPELKKLIKSGKDVVIVCGEKDKIFPPSEIRDNLVRASLDVEMIIVQGIPHSPSATRFGIILLKRALDAAAS
ncbi:hypothetical protein CSA80_01495 [Candidatus Saccharibacteria bacterium]|nr:MAG: hypothetical protein CSA80_01495 [Candidatus Saccharibacteria bacterium]